MRETKPAAATATSERETEGHAAVGVDSDTEQGSRSQARAAVRWRRPRRRSVRRALLTAGPLLVLLVGTYVYVTGGRYVSTENAYAKADMVAISPQVEGAIADVEVAENQHVERGQVLFRVDDAPFRIALMRATAQLEAVRTDLESLKASYGQKQAELVLAQTDRDFARREFERQASLAKKNLASQTALDQARHNLDVASQHIVVIRQELDQLRAQLGGDPTAPIDQHPRYQEALASRAQAALDLERTAVRAPFAGVASKIPQLGQYVKPGTAVMSVVADQRFWIEANFKETDLTYVRPDQPVTINIDTYPGRQWHGTVASLSQATGAEFSVLPPQNATGNWVKVVQRIPVRISVVAEKGAPPLRAGMSTQVEIDTGHRRSILGLRP